MGSYNTTCFVSQQTIVPGAETWILPISQNLSSNRIGLSFGNHEVEKYAHTNTTCHPTAFWGYAGPIIRGEYDDCGRFNLVDTPENKINLRSFFNVLHQGAFKTHAGENECHDFPFDFQGLYDPKGNHSFMGLNSIWEKTWEVAKEQRVFIRNNKHEPVNLGFAVMHHKAAEYLINEVDKLKSWNNVPYEQKSCLRSYIEEHFSCIQSFFSEKNNGEKSPSPYARFMFEQVASLSGYPLGDQEGTRLSNFYDGFCLAIDVFEKNGGDKAQVNEGLIDGLFKAFKTNLDHRHIHAGLDLFNLKLSPMVYASQDCSNGMGCNYAKMIAHVSQQVTQEIEIEIEDDNEDNEEMSINPR